MSWSIGKKGTKAEVKKYLDEQAPKDIAHVQGVERTLADQALGLARAAVEAIDEKFNPSVSGYGSVSFKDGEQVGQAISLTVGYDVPTV